jgi:hypothetical protein
VVLTILKKLKVNWKDYSIYCGTYKKHVEPTNQWLNVYPVPSCWNVYQQNLVKKTISGTDLMEVP